MKLHIKRIHLFILTLFLFLFFLTYIKYPLFINTHYFQDRWYPCLDRFGSGTLYENDYHCSQGPILIATLYLLQYAGGYMYTVTFFVAILLGAFLFWIMRAIINKEIEQNPQWSLLFIFGIALYYPFFTIWLDMLLSTFFLIAGLYTLYYSRHKYKEALTLLLLTVAALTKITSIPPAAAIILYYVYTTYRSQYMVLLKKVLHIILYLISLSTVLLLLWPKFFYYYLIAHYYNPNQDLSYSIYTILSGFFHIIDMYYTLFLVLALCMILLYLKRRDIYSFSSLFAVFPITLIWNQASGSQTTLLYYFTPFLTLAVLSGYCFYFEEKRRLLKIATVLILLLIITPFLMQAYLGISLRPAKVILSHAGMDFISTQIHTILIEEKPNARSLQTLFPDLVLEEKNITNLVPALSFWDYFYSPKLVALGIFPESDLTKNSTYYTDHITTEHYNLYLQRILEEEFDVLITHDNGYLNIKSLINSAVDLHENSYNCRVYIPMLYHNIDLTSGSHSAVFFFKDTGQCYGFAKEVYEYYQKHFQEICSVSSALAEEVRKVLKNNAMELPACTNAGSLNLSQYDSFTIISVYP